MPSSFVSCISVAQPSHITSFPPRLGSIATHLCTSTTLVVMSGVASSLRQGAESNQPDDTPSTAAGNNANDTEPSSMSSIPLAPPLTQPVFFFWKNDGWMLLTFQLFHLLCPSDVYLSLSLYLVQSLGTTGAAIMCAGAQCGERFGIRRRRHHCRRCGQ
jgi:hypothetical protein